jgi:hypothetical protein
MGMLMWRRLMPAKKKYTMTVTQFAESVGKSQQYISRKLKSGQIDRAAYKKKGQRYFIDPVAAEASLKSRTEFGREVTKPGRGITPGKGNKITPDDTIDYYEERARKAKADADKAEDERDLRRGKLIDGDVFFPILEKTLTGLLQSMRQRILQTPTKYMSKILNIDTLPKAQAALEKIAQGQLKTLKGIDLNKIIKKAGGGK